MSNVVESINEIRSKQSGSYILADHTEIANLIADLGQEVAKAKQAYLLAKEQHKLEEMKEFMRLRADGKTAADSEKIARTQMYDSYKELVETEAKYNAMNNLHSDCQGIRSAIKMEVENSFSKADLGQQ